jgi:hypothetical protein
MDNFEKIPFIKKNKVNKLQKPDVFFNWYSYSALFIVFLLFSSFNLVSKENNKPKIIFNSDFEGTVKIVSLGKESDIVGKGNNSSVNDWVKDLDQNQYIGEFTLQYQGGDSTMRMARICKDPFNPSNHALLFSLTKPNVEGEKGRVQANLYGNTGLNEIFLSERILFSEDFHTLCYYPDQINWLTIAEFWNNITWSKKIPYGFRIKLGIGKPDKLSNDLFFYVYGQDYNSKTEKYKTIWSEMNHELKVPIGEWFNIEIYFKEGNSTSGRFYIAIRKQNQSNTIIFDIHNFTYNSLDPLPNGISHFNPFKLYTSKKIIDYMSSKNKKLEIYWDDFEFWLNRQP